MHVMITGAASGIGKELCFCYAKDKGTQLSLVDIDRNGALKVMDQLGVPARVYKLDLADIDAVPPVIRRIEEEQGPIDVAINCAGIMFIQTMSATGWEEGLRLMTIDLFSPLRIINLLLPGMIERKKGHIVNISSMAGVITIHGCCYYGAAKAGLAFSSEILRGEVKRHGVGVTTVYLGPIDTPLEIQCLTEVYGNIWSDSIPKGYPQKTARLIHRAVKKNRPRVFYPYTYKFVNHSQLLFNWLTMRLGPDPRK